MRNAFIEQLLKRAEENDKIWLLNADLGYSVLEPFQERFPDRYLNIGVSEQNMAGIAAGIALSGFKVFIYSIGNFPTFRCLEQLRNDVCYHDADVKVVSVGGGFAYGSQGYTHHAIEDINVMRALTNMTVIAPSDPAETYAAVDYFTEKSGPGYLRLGRAGEPKLHPGNVELNIGYPMDVSEGEKQVLLISTGGILTEALAAKDKLQEHGIKASVKSFPVLKPVNEEKLIEQISGYDVVVTVEEHALVGGLRDTIAPVIASNGIPVKLVSCGIEDGITKGIIGNQGYMRQYCKIDSSAIVERTLQAI